MTDIVSLIVSSIAPSALPLVVVVLGGLFIYLKINGQRKESKSERDKEIQDIRETLLKHEFSITDLKGEITHQKTVNDDITKQVNALSEAVARFSVAVDNLTNVVNELKTDLRDMRNK